jgi:hypothetical protein
MYMNTGQRPNRLIMYMNSEQRPNRLMINSTRASESQAKRVNYVGEHRKDRLNGLYM